jgi:hypothetical protein
MIGNVPPEERVASPKERREVAVIPESGTRLDQYLKVA